MIGEIKKYASLEQRIIDAFMSTFPSFHPYKEAPVSEESQKALYSFVGDYYNLIFKFPEVIFASLHEDDCFEHRFNHTKDNKAKLYPVMRKIYASVYEVLNDLMTVAVNANINGSDNVTYIGKLKKKTVATLSALGLEVMKSKDSFNISEGNYKGMFQTINWIGAREGNDVMQVSHCIFDPNHSYMRDVFKALLGNDEAFKILFDYMDAEGFVGVDNRDRQLEYSCAKDYGKKPTPLKEAWAEKEHSGIQFRYDYLINRPISVTVRIPHFAEILGHVDDMNNAVKSIIINKYKHCNGCKYCIQTDKTGKRPLAAIKVNEDDKYAMYCPYFPGFTYVRDDAFDEEYATALVELFKFIDNLLGKKK